jgi:flagellar basal body-associated protein FliL
MRFVLIPAALFSVIGLGVVVGYGVSLIGGTQEEAAPVVIQSATAETADSTTHALPPITVGLRDAHVVRLDLHCRMHPDDVYRFQSLSLDIKKDIRDTVKDYQSTDLEGLEGKNRLRDELLTKINARIGEPMVEKVYFADFLIQ